MNYPTLYNIIYKNFPINLTSVTIYENLLNQTLVMRMKRSLVTQPLFFVVQNNNQKWGAEWQGYVKPAYDVMMSSPETV